MPTVFVVTLFAVALLLQERTQPRPDPRNIHSEIWNASNPAAENLVATLPLGLHPQVPTTFLIYSDGKTFSGNAIVDVYPGNGEVRDGKIDGNKVSFAVDVHPVINDAVRDTTIYYAGTINGDQMDLVMRWPLTAVSATDPTLELKMKARKFRSRS